MQRFNSLFLYYGLLAGLGLVLTGCATAPQPSKPATPPLQTEAKDLPGESSQIVDELLIKAHQLSQQERYDEALTIAQQALQTAQDSADLAGVSAALNDIGTLYGLRGQHQQAQTYFEQALPIAQAQSATEVEQQIQNNLAFLHRTAQRWPQALTHYQHSLRLARELSERQSEGALLNNIGLVYDGLGQPEAAREAYQQALVIAREIANPIDIYNALFNLGLNHDRQREFRTALDYYQHALQIAREQQNQASQARVLSQIGDDYTRLNRLDEALAVYAPALEAYRVLNDSAGQARILGSTGLAYGKQGRLRAALTVFEQELERQIERADLDGQSIALGHIGTVYNHLGQVSEALDYFEQAAARAQSPTSKQIAASNLSQIYQKLGRYADALTQSQTALTQTRAAGDQYRESLLLGNLAGLYAQLGDYSAALDFGQQALELARQEQFAAPEVQALGMLGLSYLLRAASEESTFDAMRGWRYLQQAVGIVRGPNPPLLEGGMVAVLTALFDAFQTYEDSKDVAEAMAHLQKALGLARGSGLREGETLTLNVIATAYRSLDQPAQSLPFFKQALLVGDALEVPGTAWVIYDGLQQAHTALQQPQLAIFYGKQAVNTLQGLRRENKALEQALQRSLVDKRAKTYERLADLLIGQGRLAEAQQVMNMLKEDEYFDFIRREAQHDPRTTAADFMPFEAPWAERYRAISKRLVNTAQELSALKSKRRQQELNATEQARYDTLLADQKTAREAFSANLDQLEIAFKELGGQRAMDFGSKDLASLRAMQGTLKRLGQGAVLIHYLLTTDRLRILLTSPLVQIHRDSAISAEQLSRMIFEYRTTLQNPQRDPLPQAQALYRVLIEPIQADLDQLDAKLLMLSLDGALRYLPLAALHDGQGFLLERYATVMYTAAAKAELRTAPAADWQAAGFGVSEAVGDFQALPAVRQELDAIVKEHQQDPVGVLPGEIHLDEAFTVERLSDLLDQGYPVVHLASHFVFRPGVDSDSFLLLGAGQRLSLAEFRTGDFSLLDVDMLTLSACETALGGADASGREIEGFGVLAQAQGAKAVLATLWPVADESTGLLMQTLYQQRQQNKLNKAEALRQAQLALLRPVDTLATAATSVRGARDPDQQTNKSHFAHPYYWAPFILMGNWL